MSLCGLRWREKCEAQRTGYANILTWDLWKGWADDLEPAQHAARELWNGLIVLWGGDESTARHYLERADAVCERAHELTVADFRDAAADYAESCREYSAGTWDQIGQSYTLDAVRLSLLADDMTAVAMLLKTSRRFRPHAEEHALLLDLSSGNRRPEAQRGSLHCWTDCAIPMLRTRSFGTWT